MADTVASLITRPAQVQAGIVECLEECLERARGGAYVALCVVGVTPDGAAATQVAGSDCAPALVGALHIAQVRVVESMGEHS